MARSFIHTSLTLFRLETAKRNETRYLANGSAENALKIDLQFSWTIFLHKNTFIWNVCFSCIAPAISNTHVNLNISLSFAWHTEISSIRMNVIILERRAHEGFQSYIFIHYVWWRKPKPCIESTKLQNEFRTQTYDFIDQLCVIVIFVVVAV